MGNHNWLSEHHFSLPYVINDFTIECGAHKVKCSAHLELPLLYGYKDNGDCQIALIKDVATFQWSVK